MKPLKSITLILTLTPAFLIAQGISEPLSKWSIGFNFSPDYSYRQIRGPESEQLFIDYRDNYDIPKFGFTTGFITNYQLNEKNQY